MRPENRPPAASAARFALWIATATAAALALVAEKIAAAGWTVAGAIVVAAALRATGPLFTRPGGAPLVSPGPANRITIVRFVWIAPVCALALGGAWEGALALYLLLALTDVADGIVARRRHESTPFGVVLDPVADVLSTFAVFTVFVVDNLVPLWLYLLLASRYIMLFAGSAVLSRVFRPIAYRATIAGKVVGVVQTAGAGAIMWGARTGGLGPDAARVVFAVLGLGFASVIASQGLIGWRHIRNATRGRT